MQFESYNQGHQRHPKQELLATLSAQAILTWVSPEIGKITGWYDSDYLGKPIQTFIHPDDISRIDDRYREIRTGKTVTFEDVRCLTKDGRYLTWTLSFVPRIQDSFANDILILRHLPDGVALNLAIGRELYLQPLAVPGLYSNKEKNPLSGEVEYAGLAKLLEGMLGNAPIGFALFDGNLRFICLNQALSEMTRFSPSQHLGQALQDLLPKVAIFVDPIMREILRSGNHVIDHEVELHSSTMADSSRYAQMSFYPIPDLHGGSCGVAMIAVDITDRKRSEEKLRRTSDELARSNRALEEFSYVASHDLREPLRTISSFVTLLKKGYQGKLDKDANEYINFAVEGAQRMQRLIDKILEYSRAGRVERSFSNVDCTMVLQTIISNLKVSLEETRGTITFDPLPAVRGDEFLLLQVFQNLVANAIKYRGSASPKIHISAKRELNTWVFSVADNGIGVSSEQFTNIFTPFRKLHSQNEYAGSGLGLAICQKNIERHGGRVWVTSQEGKGSIFFFTIPEAQAGEAPAHESVG